jgi:isoamyl acetate esterase
MSDTPRLLLLGDSIRMSYQATVAECVVEAEVVGPAENCQYAAYTRERLPVWLEELGVPDIVHWNNGLHDVGHNPARDPVQFAVDAYIGHLSAILAQLRDTGAKIVWATSTPVHPDRPFSDDSWAWRNDEIDEFNAAALELMHAEAVPVNDLHALVGSDVDRYLSEDMLHLAKDGIDVCAQAVAEAVRA